MLHHFQIPELHADSFWFLNSAQRGSFDSKWQYPVDDHWLSPLSNSCANIRAAEHFVFQISSVCSLTPLSYSRGIFMKANMYSQFDQSTIFRNCRCIWLPLGSSWLKSVRSLSISPMWIYCMVGRQECIGKISNPPDENPHSGQQLVPTLELDRTHLPFRLVIPSCDSQIIDIRSVSKRHFRTHCKAYIYVPSMLRSFPSLLKPRMALTIYR